MTEDNEKKLIEKYPKIFDRSKSDPRGPFTMFGIECNDGWYEILDMLCNAIQFHVDHNMRNVEPEDAQVIAEQIKEKFGGLRFYYRGGDEFINGLVSFAEALSYKTCEQCGSNRNVSLRKRSWIKTECDQCVESMEKLCEAASKCNEEYRY